MVAPSGGQSSSEIGLLSDADFTHLPSTIPTTSQEISNITPNIPKEKTFVESLNINVDN